MNQKGTERSIPNTTEFPTDYNDCKGCEKGIKFCKRPCWPVPQEVKNLMDAGYGDRLMLDLWARPDNEGGHIFIISPASPGHQSTWAPDAEMISASEEDLLKMDRNKVMEFMLKMALTGGDINKGCNFQTSEGLCTLHDQGLKPFEGKRTCCKVVEGEGIHEAVAMSWDTEEGREVVKQWKEQFFKS